MVDDLERNNWIIILVIASAIVIISVTIFGFVSMITNVANNINFVVNNTSKNMTALTHILIELQKKETESTTQEIRNQTDMFTGAVNSFKSVVINTTDQNDKNLKNISKILTDIKLGNNSN